MIPLCSRNPTCVLFSLVLYKAVNIKSGFCVLSKYVLGMAEKISDDWKIYVLIHAKVHVPACFLGRPQKLAKSSPSI